mgnify:CR=1 FL=1
MKKAAQIAKLEALEGVGRTYLIAPDRGQRTAPWEELMAERDTARADVGADAPATIGTEAEGDRGRAYVAARPIITR